MYLIKIYYDKTTSNKDTSEFSIAAIKLFLTDNKIYLHNCNDFAIIGFFWPWVPLVYQIKFVRCKQRRYSVIIIIFIKTSTLLAALFLNFIQL